MLISYFLLEILLETVMIIFRKRIYNRPATRNFLGQGRFVENFRQKQRKRDPPGKHFGAFSPRYS